MPFISPPPSTSNAGYGVGANKSATNIAGSSNMNDLSMLQTDLPTNNMQDSHSAAAAAVLDAFASVPSAGPSGGGIYPYLNQSSFGGMSATGYNVGGRQTAIEEDAWSVRSPASASVAMNTRPNFAPLPTTANRFGGAGMMHASATGGPIATSNNLLDDGLLTGTSGSVMPIAASHTGPGGNSWNSQTRGTITGGGAKSKEVEQFLGGHSALVDLDALLAPTSSMPKPTFGGGSTATSSVLSSNSPFNTTGGAAFVQQNSSPSMAPGGFGAAGNNNPFHTSMPQSMSMNEQIRSKQQQNVPSSSGWSTAASNGGWDSSSSGTGGILQPQQILQPSKSPFDSAGASGMLPTQQQPTAASNASYNPFL